MLVRTKQYTDERGADRNQVHPGSARSPRSRADVVMDMILSSGRQAQNLISAFRWIAGRVIAISSCDVYRACGVLHRIEEGPLEPVPLTEDSALRTRETYPREQIAKLRALVPWVDEEYDKIPVKRTVMSDPEIAGTVLRLPMVYGPGDFAHRFWPVLKRIEDGRRAIIFEESLAACAEWLCGKCRGSDRVGCNR